MTPAQEVLMTLFTDDTIQKVKKQFSEGNEKVTLESFNMSFRLFNTKTGNINLELLIQMPVESDEEENLHGLGRVTMQRTVMFFKPVGFFTQKKGFFSSTLEVTILKEFEYDLDILLTNGKIPTSIQIHKLSLRENAVLAAFSMEAFINAEKYGDTSFIANGLYCDIYLTLEGYPQVFLDDKHNLSGPIAAYLLREQNSINPIREYEELFNRFDKMELMTAFKRI